MSRFAELFERTKWFSGVMCVLSSGVKPEDVDQWSKETKKRCAAGGSFLWHPITPLQASKQAEV